MVRCFVAGAALLVASAACAQTVMDGSETAVPANDLQLLKSAAGRALADPYGAQIQRLRVVAPGRICGQINVRNSYGGLTGFRLFGFSTPAAELAVTPEGSPESAEGATGQELILLRDRLSNRLETLKRIESICTP